MMLEICYDADFEALQFKYKEFIVILLFYHNQIYNICKRKKIVSIKVDTPETRLHFSHNDLV